MPKKNDVIFYDNKKLHEEIADIQITLKDGQCISIPISDCVDRNKMEHSCRTSRKKRHKPPSPSRRNKATILPDTLSVGEAGKDYGPVRFFTTAGTEPLYKVTKGILPDKLQLMPHGGILTGRLHQAGIYNFGITAIDKG